ncbi:SGNH/GDSL hydrolase family protein [Rheinheimera mangrovi]|uniref:SGNH/GDSL hydrolase family protein n=1 Tax=Rheinheimera mangrovi TaxID=2498451 RepID=UPI000F8CC912|nr:SGNH/GDSL hydrolase family protein [Rheinheimera mangrovi]
MDLPHKIYPLWRYGVAICGILAFIIFLNWVSQDYDSRQPDKFIFSKFLPNSLNVITSTQATAITLGGSIGFSLDLATAGLKGGVNLSFSGQDFIENEAVVDVVTSLNPNSIKYVFLAVQPAGILRDNSWSGPMTRRVFYNGIRPYRGLTLVGNDWRNQLQSILFPFVRADFFSGPIRYWLGELAGIYMPSPKVQDISHSMDNAKVRERSIALLEDLLQQMKQGLYYHRESIEKPKDALVRMCEKLARKNIQLILYVTPVTAEYQRLTSEFFRQDTIGGELWEEAEQSCKKQNAVVLRFDTEPAFLHSYDMFEDTFHLNDKGSVFFSLMMKGELNKLNKGAGN